MLIHIAPHRDHQDSRCARVWPISFFHIRWDWKPQIFWISLLANTDIETRCVAIYEIGCEIPFSAGWFAEGPRLGVFRKSNLFSKKAKKRKQLKKAKSRSLLKPPGGKWNHATYFINCNTSAYSSMWRGNLKICRVVKHWLDTTIAHTHSLVTWILDILPYKKGITI